MCKERDFTLDILKFIGLSMIILAHTSISNDFVMQFRSFDVPLMVLVSGILATNSYRSDLGYGRYLLKRGKRLLIPTYIFLSLFFGIVVLLFSSSFPFSVREISRSYYLLDGIGYVWIIRVYLLCALIVPLLMKLEQKYSIKSYFLMLASVYILYEITYFLGIFNGDTVVNLMIFYLIPYGVFMGFGMILKKLSKRQIHIIICISFLIFSVIAWVLYSHNGTFIKTSTMKYPPRIYYLSYALGMSLILYRVCSLKSVMNIFDNNVIRFISKSSMWIYLWHILFVYLIQWYMPNQLHWSIAFIGIYGLSVLVVYVQNKIVVSSTALNKNNRFSKYLLG